MNKGLWGFAIAFFGVAGTVMVIIGSLFLNEYKSMCEITNITSIQINTPEGIKYDLKFDINDFFSPSIHRQQRRFYEDLDQEEKDSTLLFYSEDRLYKCLISGRIFSSISHVEKAQLNHDDDNMDKGMGTLMTGIFSLIASFTLAFLCNIDDGKQDTKIVTKEEEEALLGSHMIEYIKTQVEQTEIDERTKVEFFEDFYNGFRNGTLQPEGPEMRIIGLIKETIHKENDRFRNNNKDHSLFSQVTYAQPYALETKYNDLQ